MNQMFKSYDKVSTSNYTPDNINKYLPDYERSKLPIEVLDIHNNLIGYGWNHGDSVVLEFIITGGVYYDDDVAYEDASVYLKGKEVEITIFDYQYNVIIDQKQEASDDIIFVIDNNLSKLLIPGAYTCSLKLLSNEDVVTLFDDGHLYVK